MNIFDFNDYKKFLLSVIKSKPRGFQSMLARAMKCQASYLIQVLTKKNELTEDQAIMAASYLNLPPLEVDYFLLLVGHSRAVSDELKKFYAKKIKSYHKAKEDIKKIIPNYSEIQNNIAVEYFSNWEISLIHLLTSSSHYQTPKAISARLKIRIKRVEYVLNFLTKNNLVENLYDRWIFKGDPIFLAKESSLNFIHQANQRNQVVRSIRELNNEDLHFCSTFIISAQHFEELKKEINLLIEKSHQKITASPSEELYSLVIDLFKIV